MKIKNFMKYFKEEVLKYFKNFHEIFKYFKVKYLIMHPYTSMSPEYSDWSSCPRMMTCMQFCTELSFFVAICLE